VDFHSRSVHEAKPTQQLECASLKAMVDDSAPEIRSGSSVTPDLDNPIQRRPVLEPGCEAPDFRLPSTERRDLGLIDFRGKQIVLYFYPQDDTPDCTAEAVDFERLRDRFHQNGAEILGVSTNSIRSHARFRRKYGFDFPLLADTHHDVSQRYGVWQRRRFMGRESVGIERTTFVIGKDGRIKAVFPEVRVAGHADAVLAALDGDADTPGELRRVSPGTTYGRSSDGDY
jgi:peroxiredoxin Q/BCP